MASPRSTQGPGTKGKAETLDCPSLQSGWAQKPGGDEAADGPNLELLHGLRKSPNFAPAALEATYGIFSNVP
jgi:hypothetical protein